MHSLCLIKMVQAR